MRCGGHVWLAHSAVQQDQVLDGSGIRPCTIANLDKFNLLDCSAASGQESATPTYNAAMPYGTTKSCNIEIRSAKTSQIPQLDKCSIAAVLHIVSQHYRSCQCPVHQSRALHQSCAQAILYGSKSRAGMATYGVSGELGRHQAHASGEVVAAQGGAEAVDAIG